MSASYLATACLKKLGEFEYTQNPHVAEIVFRYFYMDDFLGGATTAAKAVELRNSLIKIIATAGMELDKWSSNDENILYGVISEDNNKISSIHEIDNTKFTKILGLYWNSLTDNFQFKIKIDERSMDLPTTKLNILSDIARIFDPLGVIGPVVIRAKLLLQMVWQARGEWNEPVSNEIQRQWKIYKTNLLVLNELIIPRQITIKNKIVNVQIHGFSDASEKAYGCCLYLRCSDDLGNNITNLICAKSKVAPMKTLSLPRLELCAAQLLARVASKIIPKMNLNISKKYYWTDSSVTLCWITSLKKKWKTFWLIECHKFNKKHRPRNGFTSGAKTIQRILYLAGAVRPSCQITICGGTVPLG